MQLKMQHEKQNAYKRALSLLIFVSLKILIFLFKIHFPVHNLAGSVGYFCFHDGN